ncbi:MAG TPA: SIS domain-containing protein [Verrucomicrobiae bacterium]|nr:SIS domain-containing protein [Verrucomicrobiae bacterium]
MPKLSKVKNRTLAASEAWQTAESVWSVEASAVQRLHQTIDPSSFRQCINALSQCQGRVLTSGCGTSAAAARKIAHSLCCIERPAVFLAPGDALHGGLGLAQPSDLAVLISKGGNTREIVSLLAPLKAKRVPIIAVTEDPASALGQAADFVLRVKVEREPDEFNMLATASTMAVVAVFDAICIALMKRTRYTQDRFAIIHPGGAVGERLLSGEKPSKSRPVTTSK